MEAWNAVTLPGGWWSENVLHRTALVRPLTGDDEEALLERNAALLPERTSALIARCVRRLGAIDAVTEEYAAELIVGDREALVLALRRLTFGERLQCVIDCSACGEAMDVDLTVGDLLLAPYGASAPTYEESIRGNDGDWRVRYRLPTGADQAAVARACAESADGGARELLARCVLDVTAPAGVVRDAASVPDFVAEALGDRMAALDPQAEIALNFACPTCAAQSSTILDAADLFFRELATGGDALYLEVHRLALHYHWSERDILALPRGKRRRYLALLADSGRYEA
jgi:hypothetical protein